MVEGAAQPRPRVRARPRAPLLIGLAATAAVMAASGTATYARFENALLDQRFARRRPVPTSDRIVHVDIDDLSVERLGQFPWTRDRYAHALDSLSEAGAESILFDVEFPEASKNEIDRERVRSQLVADVARRFSDLAQAGGEFLAELDRARESIQGDLRQAVTDHDEAFERAIRASGRVYLPFSLEHTPARAAGHIEGEADEDAVRTYLQRDLAARAATVAARLGLAEDWVDVRLTTLKRSVAMERIEALLAERPDVDLETVQGELLPGVSVAHETDDVKIVERAYDRTRSAVLVRQRHAVPLPAGEPDPAWGLVEPREILPPLPQLLDAARASGYVSITPDPVDGVLRRVRLFSAYRGRLYPQLAFRALCDHLGADLSRVEIRPGHHVRLRATRPVERTITIPVDAECGVLLDWAGTPEQPFVTLFGKHLPFYQLVEIQELRAFIGGRQLADLDALAESLGGKGIHHVPADDVTRTTVVKYGRRLASLVHAMTERLPALRAELGAATDPAERTRLEEKLRERETRVHEMIGEAAAQAPPVPEDSPFASNLEDAADTLRYLAANIEKERVITARLRELVQGRICIIGETLTGSTDQKHTPLHPAMAGVSVHSNLLNTILQGAFIHRAGPLANLLVIGAAGLLTTLLASRLGPVHSTTGTLLAAVAYVGGAFVAFDRAQWWVDVAGPVVAFATCFAGITAYRQLTEEREKRQIRSAFQVYLHPEVVAQVTEDPGALKLGGERRELTVFFSDVAGFTTISEALPPEALVALLNEYLTAMSDQIMETGGTVDKYEGDAIMAFWGAPLAQPDHALRACEAALRNQERLAVLREAVLARGGPSLTARIGLNSGPMLVGNMGSQHRFNYTVMGDAVNLGSRLEGANKEFGTRIMVSESTRALALDRYEFRPLDLLRVKGKTQPVPVHELVARRGGLSEARRVLHERYATALDLYRALRFEEAAAAFRACLEADPRDGPSQTYLARCTVFASSPPGEDWDGAFTMTTK
ncbi:MAG: adenylate/guanylate cyclase domain-containing protein [Planctomycetes bacterium]|nr:adenylate/guanylate cyclase domain-containing protein [Planctomycetota bacterium]